jgi:peptidyl-prolyl cis-trans isomerase C
MNIVKAVIVFMVVGMMVSGCAKKTDVAIKVEGKEITKTQIMRVADVFREQYARLQPAKALVGMGSELTKGAARQLIANVVLFKEAQKHGIIPDSANVRKTYNELKKRAPDAAAFQRELTRMGETEEGMLNQIREGTCIDSLVKLILARVDSVTTKECKDFYEQNKDRFISMPSIKVSQLLFPLDSTATASKRKQTLDKVNEVLVDARSNKDFNSLVKKYGTGSVAVTGGDMGWFKQGDLRPELEQVAFRLNKNEVSNVVSSKLGYHILKKTDEKKGETQTFDQVKDRIRMNLEIQKRNEKVVQYIDSLISLANVQYLDTNFEPGSELLGSGNR